MYQMLLCNDAVITYELTARFLEDRSFQYLGNRILNHGIGDISNYRYRINFTVSPVSSGSISESGTIKVSDGMI